MTTSNDQVVQTLNLLVETSKDGENGYATAAEAVRTPQLKQLLGSYARQRALFAAELQTEVQRLGGAPEKAGSIAGVFHRGWMNLKALVTGMDEQAIFAECEKGDQAAVSAYEEALVSTLPSEAKTLIARQLDQIKDALEHVHALEVVAATA